MNRSCYYLFIIILSLILSSVQAQTPNSWVGIANFRGMVRGEPISFNIDSFGYLGLGLYQMDTFPFTRTFLNDLWQYNAHTNVWVQKASFPGNGRTNSICFTIGSKAYLGLGDGYNSPGVYKDIWEYNTSTDTWVQKGDFPGGYRTNAIGFSIGAMGYTGLGSSDSAVGDEQDFWEYEPNTDTWTQKGDFAGGGRVNAIGFSIGNNGYVGFGDSTNNTRYYKNDFWQYDPVADSWTQKTSFAGKAREGCFVLSIGDKGYIGTGVDSGGQYLKDFWEYNSSTDQWIEKDSFGGVNRLGASGFSIGNKGYAGIGGRSTTAQYYNDFWVYTPDSLPTGIRSLDESSISIYPDPVSDRLIINNLEPHTPIIITDMLGQVMIRDIAETSKISIDVSALPPGVYCVNNRKFVKE